MVPSVFCTPTEGLNAGTELSKNNREKFSVDTGGKDRLVRWKQGGLRTLLLSIRDCRTLRRGAACRRRGSGPVTHTLHCRIRTRRPRPDMTWRHALKVLARYGGGPFPRRSDWTQTGGPTCREAPGAPGTPGRHAAGEGASGRGTGQRGPRRGKIPWYRCHVRAWTWRFGFRFRWTVPPPLCAGVAGVFRVLVALRPLPLSSLVRPKPKQKTRSREPPMLLFPPGRWARPTRRWSTGDSPSSLSPHDNGRGRVCGRHQNVEHLRETSLRLS